MTKNITEVNTKQNSSTMLVPVYFLIMENNRITSTAEGNQSTAPNAAEKKNTKIINNWHMRNS